jgi:ribosomal protein L17
VTTLPKAKDLRPIVEKLVTLGKRAICTRAAW